MSKFTTRVQKKRDRQEGVKPVLCWVDNAPGPGFRVRAEVLGRIKAPQLLLASPVFASDGIMEGCWQPAQLTASPFDGYVLCQSPPVET